MRSAVRTGEDVSEAMPSALFHQAMHRPKGGFRQHTLPTKSHRNATTVPAQATGTTRNPAQQLRSHAAKRRQSVPAPLPP